MFIFKVFLCSYYTNLCVAVQGCEVHGVGLSLSRSNSYSVVISCFVVSNLLCER